MRVYDVVDEGERLWIVMELVDGRSLERILAEDGPLSPRGTARIGLGLVEALRQVHARGVLHRDIKPGNVLVERRAGRIVLTDFGIAAIQDAEALTMVGMLVGSPDYMAPERVSGRHQGPPSDLWSLGATLCAALGGRSPFSRATTLATLHAVLYEEPEIPSAAGELREVLSALLLKDPSVRPGLEELAAILGPVADGSTGASAPPGTTAGLGTAVGPGQPEPAEPAELTEPARPVGRGRGSGPLREWWRSPERERGRVLNPVPRQGLFQNPVQVQVRVQVRVRVRGWVRGWARAQVRVRGRGTIGSRTGGCRSSTIGAPRGGPGTTDRTFAAGRAPDASVPADPRPGAAARDPADDG